MSLSSKITSWAAPVLAVLGLSACATRPPVRVGHINAPVAKDSTRLSGMIEDRECWLRSSVEVTIASRHNKRLVTRTDGVGYFEVQNLPPDYYDIEFRLGKLTAHKAGVLVLRGKETRLNAVVEPDRRIDLVATRVSLDR